MKLFSIFMLVFTLGGFASGYSQKQVVTLNLKQCDVNTLLQEIWKQTGLRFVYNEQDVAQLKRFDVNAQQKQVDEILDHIFKNTPYQCAYESDVIYITPRPVGDLPQVKQERVKLSGNIKDKNGNVLPGVTVFIGNSDIGTSSDINGNYQLAILKGNAVEIVYSFIGMKKVTYNFPATEDVRHNVVMEEDQVELQDVVVIGYGSKSARNLQFRIVGQSERPGKICQRSHDFRQHARWSSEGGIGQSKLRRTRCQSNFKHPGNHFPVKIAKQ